MAREMLDPDSMGADQYPEGDAPPANAMPNSSQPTDAGPDLFSYGAPDPSASVPPGAQQQAPPPPLVSTQPAAPDPVAPPRGSDIGIAGMRTAQRQGNTDALVTGQEIAKGYDARANAEAAKVELEAQTARDLAPFKVQEAELAQRYEAQTVAASELAKQSTARQVSKVQELEQQLASSGATQGFWANKGVGSQIGWAVALGLGAFAQAASRGQIQTNGAMQMFDRALALDAQDKSRQLAVMRDRIGGERSLIGEMRATFGSDKSALQANYIAGMGKIEALVKAQLANSQDQAVIAQGNTLLADIQQRKAEAMGQFVQHQDTQNFAQAHAISGALQTKEQMDYTKMIAEYNAHAKAAAAQKGTTYAYTVPGFLPSQNKESGDKLTELTAQWMATHDQVGGLADMVAPMGADGKRKPVGAWKAFVKDPVNVASLNQMSSALTLSLLENFHRGAAVSDDEWKLVNAVRGVGVGGEIAWNAFAPESVAHMLDWLDNYSKKQVYNYAMSSGQATPEMVKADPLKSDNFEKLPWDQYVATTPRMQKAVRGQ